MLIYLKDMRNDENKIENRMIKWRGESDIMKGDGRMAKNWEIGYPRNDERLFE